MIINILLLKSLLKLEDIQHSISTAIQTLTYNIITQSESSRRLIHGSGFLIINQH